MGRESTDLTEAEWSVMECLWEGSPKTGREVVERLKELKGWSRSTTLTLLRRLETKGAAASDNDGELKTFRPLIRREDAEARETESFLDRVYKGSVSLMVSTLTKKQSISKTELDELYALLRDMEGGEDG